MAKITVCTLYEGGSGGRFDPVTHSPVEPVANIHFIT